VVFAVVEEANVVVINLDTFFKMNKKPASGE
jgi:hypothetical protein